MVSLDDVRAIASALPEVEEGEIGFHHTTGWKVRGKGFVWERPLRQRDVADLEALGQRVPEGEIVALRVAAADKEAVLASTPGVFHVPHFNGYPAVLVELAAIDREVLRELITDAWIVQAPKRLSRAYLESGSAGTTG